MSFFLSDYYFLLSVSSIVSDLPSLKSLKLEYQLENVMGAIQFRLLLQAT